MQLIATAKVKGLVEVSLLDWPGRVATVLFLPGCNFRCRYCHAGDLLEDGGEFLPLEGIFDYISRQEGWIDGVVLSGGEPTLHPGLGDLAREIKSRGLGVKLDTNGTMPGVLRALLDERLLDGVSMDVKAPLDGRYSRITQTEPDLDAVSESIDLLMASEVDCEFRTTVAPSLLSPADIGEIAQRLRGARRYTLQPFRPHSCLDKSMEEEPPCPVEVLHDAARLAEGLVERVEVRE